MIGPPSAVAALIHNVLDFLWGNLVAFSRVHVAPGLQQGWHIVVQFCEP